MPLATSQISAVILAGGKGTRMGGINKGLVNLQGRPMIQHVIDKLVAQVGSIIISANQDIDQYRAFGYEVIEDLLPESQGPLVGIYSALMITNTDWLICAPCDVPGLPLDLVSRLSDKDPSCLARVVHDGTRQQSACCLLHVSLRNKLKEFILSGQHAVHRFLTEQNVVEVDFSDQASAFANINTPQELQRHD